MGSLRKRAGSSKLLRSGSALTRDDNCCCDVGCSNCTGGKGPYAWQVVVTGGTYAGTYICNNFSSTANECIWTTTISGPCGGIDTATLYITIAAGNDMSFYLSNGATPRVGWIKGGSGTWDCTVSHTLNVGGGPGSGGCPTDVGRNPVASPL